MFGGLGAPELLVIFAIVLLLFGGKKLPEVAKSMGSAMRAFRDEANTLKREIDLEGESETSKSTQQSAQSTASSADSAEAAQASSETNESDDATSQATTTTVDAETDADDDTDKKPQSP